MARVTRARRGDGSSWGSLVLVAVLVMTGVPLVVYGLTLDSGSSPDGVARQSSGLSSASPAPSATVTPEVTATDEAASGRAARNLAVYFGDSYFVGDFNYTNKSNTMARLSGKRLGYAQIRVRGGGGTGFVEDNPEFNLPPYLQQLRGGALNASNPDLVVIEGGSNDARARAPKWKVRRNAGLVLNFAREKHPGAMLVMVGPLDVDGDYTETTPIHKAIRKAAVDQGVPYIDIRRWLAGHYDDLVGADRIHPTAEGHRFLGRKLSRALSALGA